MGKRSMLTLSSRKAQTQNFPNNAPRMIVRLTSKRNRPHPLRAREAYLVSDDNLPPGFDIYVALQEKAALLSHLPLGTKAVILTREFDYIGDGDVLRLWPQ